MARTHLAITVELVHGVHTGDLWPRPGRVLIAARTTTFEQFGKAIDDAFARWDHNHLDLGDNWQHLCTVAPQRADPLETLGIIPVGPLPCWGWGDIPDQYSRRWDGDDGSSRMPKPQRAG